MTAPAANQVLQIKWPQIITILVAFLSAAIVQWVMISNKLAANEIVDANQAKEIAEIKSKDKESDRDVVVKLDKIQEDVNAIKVELERKQNRQ